MRRDRNEKPKASRTANANWPQVREDQDAAMNRRQQIEAMLEQDATDSFLRYALALEWAGEGHPEKAIGEFHKLLAQDPGYIPAYLQAGQLLVKAGQSEAARAMMEKGIQVARQGNDDHAAEEMAALLATLPLS